MDDASRVQLQNALKALLVDRADEEAWRVLYEQARTTALDAGKRVLRRQIELADDVVQEAFLRIFRYCKFADFPDTDAFLRYLRTVCGNAARDMLKDSAAESIIESAEGGEREQTRVLTETPEDVVIAQETLNKFMNQLNETDREILSLSMEGYDLAEIANQLGLSYSNAGVRLHRSRGRLRSHLKKRDESVTPVRKKLGENEVLCSQKIRVERQPDSRISARGTQGPNQPRYAESTKAS
jgi:RNA polymerase sigma factor (sigma-70 family)